jgi:hypothetical protein
MAVVEWSSKPRRQSIERIVKQYIRERDDRSSAAWTYLAGTIQFVRAAPDAMTSSFCLLTSDSEIEAPIGQLDHLL